MRSFVHPIFGALLAFAACGPSAGSNGADALVTQDPCSPGAVRCVGQSHQVCGDDGFYVGDMTCDNSKECDPDLGCVDCRPSRPQTCAGDAVHACNSDGTVGDFIEMCEFEQCGNGNCGGDDCVAAAELIYLVDDANNLYSFDPRLLPADPYRSIGVLSCPNAGNALPGFDPTTPPATPFSMSVDRNATAWVLYSSGKLFEVSTANAACTGTTFQVAQNGYELFGMGFVSDSPGSSDETLYISGGAADVMGSGNLGTINMSTLTVSNVGTLVSSEYSPELTGTGDAELFGYFPGTSSSVAEIVKSSGANGQVWNLPSLTGTVRAWAFAHWGGKFYIFITTNGGVLNPVDTANVLLLDPGTGGTTTPLMDTGKIIVGAGVSTCAPVIIN